MATEKYVIETEEQYKDAVTLYAQKNAHAILWRHALQQLGISEVLTNRAVQELLDFNDELARGMEEYLYKKNSGT